MLMLIAFNISVYEFLDYETVNLIVIVLNTVIVASFPLNFGIYCGMSR